VTLPFINVPAECLEERIEALAAELGLVVVAGAVGRDVPVEAFDEIVNFPEDAQDSTPLRQEVGV